MRLATIDVGTNAAKLLIADLQGPGRLRSIAERRHVIRLGEGVDESGMIDPSAMERLIGSLKEFKREARRFGADRLIVAGTSASRDARENLVETVFNRTGLQFEILSGDEEAIWSFWGALADFPERAGPCITCDIGGGSTEVVFGYANGAIEDCCSLDIGSVRVTERFFTTQPPSTQETRRATEFIRNSLASCALTYDKPAMLVGASNTHRLLLSLIRQPPASSRQLSRQAILALQRHLLVLRQDQVLALHATELSGRADIFPAAVLICSEVMRYLNKEVITVSRWGLCHGLALRAFKDCLRSR